MKKVAKRVLVGFRGAPYQRVQEHMKVTGQNETDAINDLIVGHAKFGPNAEEWLAKEKARTGKSREAILEGLVIERMIADLSSAQTAAAGKFHTDSPDLARKVAAKSDASNQRPPASKRR